MNYKLEKSLAQKIEELNLVKHQIDTHANNIEKQIQTEKSVLDDIEKMSTEKRQELMRLQQQVLVKRNFLTVKLEALRHSSTQNLESMKINFANAIEDAKRQLSKERESFIKDSELSLKQAVFELLSIYFF